MGSDEIVRPFEELVENVTPRWSLLRRLLARRRAQRLERTRLPDEQQLAWRVQDIFAGSGLIQADYSIGGGRSVYVPQVVAVDTGPPVKLDIRTLPGQTPNDFAAHAPAIAYHLGVAEVRVIPLAPPLIRLELLPELRQQAEERRKLNEDSAALRASRPQPGQDSTHHDLHDKIAVVEPSESPKLVPPAKTGSRPISASTSDLNSEPFKTNHWGEGEHPRSSVTREQAADKKTLVQTTLPITIYLSDESAHEQVEAAVEHLLTAAGAQIEHRDDPVRGSWFRRMRAKIRMFLDSPVGNEAKNLTLHAAETRLVHTQDATVTATLLQNLGSVLLALQTTKEAVIRTGALLIVKIDSTLVVHQLTPTQQLHLDHQPQLAQSPHQILSALEIQPGSSTQLAESVGDNCGSNAAPQSLNNTPSLRKFTTDNGELPTPHNVADHQIFPEASSGA